MSLSPFWFFFGAKKGLKLWSFFLQKINFSLKGSSQTNFFSTKSWPFSNPFTIVCEIAFQKWLVGQPLVSFSTQIRPCRSNLPVLGLAVTLKNYPATIAGNVTGPFCNNMKKKQWNFYELRKYYIILFN